jgi:hypothetical protein
MKSWLSANARVLQALLADLNTPLSLAVSLQIENKEWDALALRWVDPQHYPEGIFSALKYLKDVQAVDLLRKAPLPTTFNRRDVAFAAWETAETQCFFTNERLERLRGPYAKTASETSLLKYFRKVRNRIGRWLGPLPKELDGGFGPGTCVEYQEANPTVVDKIWLTPTTTPNATALFRWHYDNTLWGAVRWAERLGAPGLSEGNRLTTVPKDGKTDRPISIEPLGNLWLQLGIGRFLKHRLKMIGLPAYKPDSWEVFPGYHLKRRDAQAVHRDLLLRCQNEFSTIDLSSASDTIALELVRELLPNDWFELLYDCRSPKTFVPSKGGGRWRVLEKFSSMGNGFTFELESLIFTALLSVAFGLKPGQDLWVFGDDIILPKEHFGDACNLLSVCGFTVNRRKSYHDGPFYESCGGNIHSNVDVTPIRLKGELEDPAEVYAFHNALLKRGFSRKLLRMVRDWIPKRLQFPGPERLGDVVLHGLPYRVIEKHSMRFVKALRVSPSINIPLERWSPELSVVALLLGSRTRVVRRGVPVQCRDIEASIS